MLTFGLDAERFDVLALVEGNHFWFVARRELIIGLLRQYVPRKVPLLLDMGCGPGLNLCHWSEFADRVLGVDQHTSVSPAGQSAAQVDRSDIVNGDVTKLPFNSDSVNVALLLDVLEHADDRKTLSEAFRVLRPGGALLLSVPAHAWLWGSRDIGASHLRRYSRRGLRATVEETGFEIETIRPYQFLLMPLVILSRLLSKVVTKTRDMEDQPSYLVNGALKWINRMEVRASLSFMAMPTGSSYTLVARKPE